MMANSPMRPCDDFDQLDTLWAFPADALAPTEAADAFILALALAYNDLKDAMWVRARLDECAPSPKEQEEITAYNGQRAGMLDGVSRRVFAVVFEVVQAIAEATRSGVIDAPPLVKILDTLGADVRSVWGDLAKLASGEADGPVLRYLLRVRNDLGMHYYQPKQLMRGYKEHFLKSESADDGRRAFAFMSLGDTMGATRFYFADAAAQQARALLDPDGKIIQEAAAYIFKVNSALRVMVDGYLRMRIYETDPNWQKRPATRQALQNLRNKTD
jgi:hypothetical protein